MMDAEETRKRLAAADFAVQAYAKMKHNRSYALGSEARDVLGILAKALHERRSEEGRSDLDGKQPTSWQEFFDLIGSLNAAGCNLLQRRPGDPPPVPTPWRDPATNELLPNPWTTKNLKGQSILERRDPALAAHFKAMAEDPYGTIARMQDAAAERQARQSVPYGQREHASNPFLATKTNETAKGAFVKRDPLLAEFYQEEAAPVSIPIFGKNKNQTVVGRLVKDPHTSGLVQLAERIYEQWQAADRAAALKQRAVAEELLRRLEGAVA
jgi:hypothetical protein